MAIGARLSLRSNLVEQRSKLSLPGLQKVAVGQVLACGLDRLVKCPGATKQGNRTDGDDAPRLATFCWNEREDLGLHPSGLKPLISGFVRLPRDFQQVGFRHELLSLSMQLH